ncbi:MAG TPA: CapA family protein [Steroidobacter sp.]
MTSHSGERHTVTLFLTGDVMTGRGIDQILPHPCEPQIDEPEVTSAYEYVELAERAHGKIVGPPEFSYIWGDVLGEFERRRPTVRIVNLETAVTVGGEPCGGRAIHYRMNPRNVECLTAAGIDCCVLANNHTMDWGRDGLSETVRALRAAGVSTAGAGMNLAEACRPAQIELSERHRVLVFAYGTADSGIPSEWEATEYRPGVCVLDDLSPYIVQEVAGQVAAWKRSGDVVIVSLHWGGHWGYEVSDEQRHFAHQLIDVAGVHLVHGHSAHHPKPIEVYRDKLILYGCGDLLNDYEGIGGYERYRPELGLMYFPEVDLETGDLIELTMTPTCTSRLQVNRADRNAARWLGATLSRECRPFGTLLTQLPDDRFTLGRTEAVKAIA